MKKPRFHLKQLNLKRAIKAAKRKKIRKEKMKRHKEAMLSMKRMSPEELEEFLGEEVYDE